MSKGSISAARFPRLAAIGRLAAALAAGGAFAILAWEPQGPESCCHEASRIRDGPGGQLQDGGAVPGVVQLYRAEIEREAKFAPDPPRIAIPQQAISPRDAARLRRPMIGDGRVERTALAPGKRLASDNLSGEENIDQSTRVHPSRGPP